MKELYGNTDLVRDIERKTLKWMEHEMRMKQERIAGKIFEGRPEGRRKVGRQLLRWLMERAR